MDLFKIIIVPFIFVVEQLFHFSFNLSDNYGVSIILLSFFISLILLPIFILIEKAKRKDDAIKLTMKPFVEEIKRCYKGQERFYYLKTLNRQHSYSPLRALIPILSLLLQIPFFIAAYQFLEGFEPLSGIGFLFIKDLSQPDALFGVINILPIAMTLVNLLTAYFYTRNGNSSERRQMLIVAGIFLVLLFKLPSGLVLYWTMNNVFSFFRLFVANPEVFKKTGNLSSYSIIKKRRKLIGQLLNVSNNLKIAFYIIAAVGIISQFIWAFQNSFDDVVIRIISVIFGSAFIILGSLIVGLIFGKIKQLFLKIDVSLNVFLLIFSIVFYFLLAASLYFSGVNEKLNLIAALAIVPLQLIAFKFFIENKKNITFQLYSFQSFLLIVMFVFQALNIVAFFNNHNLSFSIFNTLINISVGSLSYIILFGILFSFVPTFSSLKQLFANLSAKLIDKHWTLFLLAGFYITGLIFLWYPLIVFSSSPKSFGFSAISIVQENIVLFLSGIFFLVVVYRISPKRIKRILLLLLLSLTIVVFFNVFIFPIDMGTLQMNRFSNVNRLGFSNIEIIFEFLFLIGTVWLVDFIIKKDYSKQLIITLSLLNVVIISQVVLISFLPNLNKNKTVAKNKISLEAENNFKLKTNQSISFSKKRENVIVIMADMFQGWYVRRIMENDTTLKETFNGFTWYPNTLSVSNYTAGSMPAILSGFDFIPSVLDKDAVHTLREKTVIANEQFRDKVKTKGYHFTSTSVPYSNMDKNTIDSYLPLWHTDWDYLKNILSIGNSRELSYTVLWQNALFFAVPKFIKSIIYNNGSWLIGEKEVKQDTKLSEQYNFMRALPYISDTNNKKANFTLICTKASHFPWDIVDNNGVLHQNITPYENNTWTLERIADWLNWMKENGVYENTKIIIVSDHGIRDTEIDESIMVENPFTPKVSERIPLKHLLYYTPLLMVKDFNSKSAMKTDNRFMSNADVPSIAFDDNNQIKMDSLGERILEAYLISWRIKVNKDIRYPIDKVYQVKNDVFNLKNWKEIK